MGTSPCAPGLLWGSQTQRPGFGHRPVCWGGETQAPASPGLFLMLLSPQTISPGPAALGHGPESGCGTCTSVLVLVSLVCEPQGRGMWPGSSLEFEGSHLLRQRWESSLSTHPCLVSGLSPPREGACGLLSTRAVPCHPQPHLCPLPPTGVRPNSGQEGHMDPGPMAFGARRPPARSLHLQETLRPPLPTTWPKVLKAGVA